MSTGQEASKKHLLSRLLIKTGGLIPVRLRKYLFIVATRLYYSLFQKRRLLALYNLRLSFPEKTMDEIISIAKGAYRHVAVVASELFDIPRLTPDKIRDVVEIEGLENCRQALEKGKGIILYTAHFGNWELSAVALSYLLQPLFVVYRPLDNAVLNNAISSLRTGAGNVLIPKERAMRQILRSLQKNRIIGILIDQNMARHEGVFVEYFSRLACTTDVVAKLAMRKQAAVIPAFCPRMPCGKYRLILGKALETIDTGNKQVDVKLNTQNYTRAIELMVRKYPEQWFWFHHRWKTRP